MPRPPEIRRDRWSAAGLGLIAIAYLVLGRRYPLDTLAEPGPGVFPLAAGTALLGLALWQLVATPGGRAPDADSLAPSHRGAPWLVAAVLVTYAAVLPTVGFVLASFALVVVTARLMGLPGWWRPLALGAGVAIATRLVFLTWLGVPLP